MQVYLDRVRRWLPAIAHTPIHRRALLAATGVTAMAALAAGPAGTAGGSMTAADAAAPSQPAATAASSQPAATQTPERGAASGDSGAQSQAGSGSTSGATGRDAKINAAKAKAEEKKAAAAGKIKGGGSKAGQGKSADRTAPNGEAGKAPSTDELLPNGTPGGQQSFTPSVEQMRNAEEIVDTGKKMKLPERAYVIAVATSLQESKLQNLGHLGANNDHDSLGLFQQRPSSGWGTPEQITDPDYAAEQFYQALEQVPGYETMPLAQAAQTVQVSAFPGAYAQWEKMAADIVQATYGAGPYADVAAADK